VKRQLGRGLGAAPQRDPEVPALDQAKQLAVPPCDTAVPDVRLYFVRQAQVVGRAPAAARAAGSCRARSQFLRDLRQLARERGSGNCRA
jgi:hypothetical protein